MAVTDYSEPLNREDLATVVAELVDEKVEEQIDAELQQYTEQLAQAEQERDELRKRLQRMPSNSTLRYTFAKMAEEVSGEAVEDYSKEPHEHMSKFAVVRNELNELYRTVEAHKATLQTVGHGKADGKEDAWKRTVEAANNLHGTAGENTVTVDGRYDVVLFASNIQQATGYSERYCLSLLEEFGEKHGVTWKPYEPPSEQNNGNARRKRLYLDLDVWDD
jgi:chromosome segregation ATPase